MRRSHFCLLSLLALLLFSLTISSASAESGLELSFSWQAEDQTLSIAPDHPTGQGDVLFLPGNCDADDLTVTLTKYEEICWGGKTVRSGDKLDLTGDIGATVAVTLPSGRTLADVRVMRGSPISSIHLILAEEDYKYLLKNKKNDISDPAYLVMVDEKGKVECADSLTSFHMHGNSTIYAPKKPFQFKLSHKADLGGMGKDKTWLLLANWFDVSLLRNQITLDLCKELGLRGTPECRQVELYINGSYNGAYLLTEKIQLDKTRLDITDLEEELESVNEKPLDSYKLRSGAVNGVPIVKWYNVPNEPEDITGGYLLEIEKPLHFTKNKEDGGFVTDGKMCVTIKEPSQVGPEEAAYIAALVNDFHNAVLQKDGVSQKTGRSYSDFIDMRSFAAKIIVEELSCNYDVRAASQFMYKDSDAVDDKLYAGPGWDYDLTYGNKATGITNPLRPNYVYRRSSDTSHLYHYLLTHEDFTALVRELFVSDAQPAIEVLLGRRSAIGCTYLHSFNDYAANIALSAEMNFTRWSTNVIEDLYAPSGKTFGAATAYLKTWIAQRFDMMVSEWLVPAS